MIGRGKQGAIYLYEVTEQDLLFSAGPRQQYRPGNVLLFADKRAVRLGAELAVAEDLSTAREYLAAREQAPNNRFEELADEKLKLEQELAERITELVELSLQNDDLRKQLAESRPSGEGDTLSACVPETEARSAAGAAGTPGAAGTAGALGAAGTTDSPVAASTLNTPNTPSTPTPSSAPEVLTTASGKKIHIMHEFPTPPAHAPGMHALRLLARALRVAATILLMALLLVCVSTVATAQANDISYGAALDLITKGFGLP
ncbi:MAG: hypothetical protein LBC23_03650 [Coriobacteriales bacterium]|jgi:hypothetical protein|nr:hypothetical protein [Coriobacteriales bacterium]